MKDIKEIMKKLEDLYYWESTLQELHCEYFADEVTLVWDNDKTTNVEMTLYGCIKVLFEHCEGYEKPMPSRDLPETHYYYFFSDISMDYKNIVTKHWYQNKEHIKTKQMIECKMIIHPLTVNILCESIEIKVIPNNK